MPGFKESSFYNFQLTPSKFQKSMLRSRNLYIKGMVIGGLIGGTLRWAMYNKGGCKDNQTTTWSRSRSSAGAVRIIRLHQTQGSDHAEEEELYPEEEAGRVISIERWMAFVGDNSDIKIIWQRRGSIGRILVVCCLSRIVGCKAETLNKSYYSGFRPLVRNANWIFSYTRLPDRR